MCKYIFKIIVNQVFCWVIRSAYNVSKIFKEYYIHREEKVHLPWMWMEEHRYSIMVRGHKKLDYDDQ